MIVSCGDPNYKTIQFEWFLTNWCNYSCFYCSEITKLIDQYSKEHSPGKYKLVLSRLKNIKENFVIELIGGEPTLHPNIDEILIELNNNEYCKEIQLITNLSRPLKFYENINSLGLNKLKFLASFHPEFYKPEWLDKVTAISNLSVTLNLSDKEEHWPLTIQTIQELTNRNVVLAFNILNPTPKWKPNYTEKFYETFNPYINNGKHNEYVEYRFSNGDVKVFNESEIIEKNLDKLKGINCTPIRYRITHEGDIHNFCTNRKLPLIVTNADIFKKERCPNECCGCDAMFKFYKYT